MGHGLIGVRQDCPESRSMICHSLSPQASLIAVAIPAPFSPPPYGATTLTCTHTALPSPSPRHSLHRPLPCEIHVLLARFLLTQDAQQGPAGPAGTNGAEGF